MCLQGWDIILMLHLQNTLHMIGRGNPKECKGGSHCMMVSEESPTTSYSLAWPPG